MRARCCSLDGLRVARAVFGFLCPDPAAYAAEKLALMSARSDDNGVDNAAAAQADSMAIPPEEVDPTYEEEASTMEQID